VRQLLERWSITINKLDPGSPTCLRVLRRATWRSSDAREELDLGAPPRIPQEIKAPVHMMGGRDPTVFRHGPALGMKFGAQNYPLDHKGACHFVVSDERCRQRFSGAPARMSPAEHGMHHRGRELDNAVQRSSGSREPAPNRRGLKKRGPGQGYPNVDADESCSRTRPLTKPLSDHGIFGTDE